MAGFSAFQYLSLPGDVVTVEKLAVALPQEFGHLQGQPALCHRLKVEALYAAAVADQQEEVAEVRRDEALIIPDSIDYAAYVHAVDFSSNWHPKFLVQCVEKQ
ncbi:hypothetical protein PR048_026309 [Dryococelus australis]|uniref:Uncharacterized protein n=1 Tax=Dryococelus australis TaxID=614101 RepID=A0ABQ9GKZ7_9NEOP|nr:hypothetical protein PR048_026309 [Dryococelus australis]